MGHEVPGKCDPAGARHVAVDHVQGVVHVFVVVRVPIVLSGDDLDLAPRGVPEEDPDLFALGGVRHNPHSVRPIAEIGSYLGIAVGVAPASERPLEGEVYCEFVEWDRRVSAEDKAESHSLRDSVALSCGSYRHAVILSPRTDTATRPASFQPRVSEAARLVQREHFHCVFMPSACAVARSLLAWSTSRVCNSLA